MCPPVEGKPVTNVVILVSLYPLEFNLTGQCLDAFAAVQGQVIMGHVGVQCAWVTEAFDAPFTIQPESNFAFCDAVLLADQLHHCEYPCDPSYFAPVSALFLFVTWSDIPALDGHLGLLPWMQNAAVPCPSL